MSEGLSPKTAAKVVKKRRLAAKERLGNSYSVNKKKKSGSGKYSSQYYINKGPKSKSVKGGKLSSYSNSSDVTKPDYMNKKNKNWQTYEPNCYS